MSYQMTDLDTFVEMLARAGVSHRAMSRSTYLADSGGCSGWTPGPHCWTVVRVNGGSRAHFEASFGLNGDLLSMGQWEEL